MDNETKVVDHDRMPESWWKTLIAVYAATDDNTTLVKQAQIHQLAQVAMGFTFMRQTTSARLRRMHGLGFIVRKDNGNYGSGYGLSEIGLSLVFIYENAIKTKTTKRLFAIEFVPAFSEYTKKPEQPKPVLPNGYGIYPLNFKATAINRNKTLSNMYNPQYQLRAFGRFI